MRCLRAWKSCVAGRRSRWPQGDIGAGMAGQLAGAVEHKPRIGRFDYRDRMSTTLPSEP